MYLWNWTSWEGESPAFILAALLRHDFAVILLGCIENQQGHSHKVHCCDAFTMAQRVPTTQLDTTKLIGPRTLAAKRWVGPVKLVYNQQNLTKIQPPSGKSPKVFASAQHYAAPHLTGFTFKLNAARCLLELFVVLNNPADTQRNNVIMTTS